MKRGGHWLAKKTGLTQKEGEGRKCQAEVTEVSLPTGYFQYFHRLLRTPCKISGACSLLVTWGGAGRRCPLHSRTPINQKGAAAMGGAGLPARDQGRTRVAVTDPLQPG